MSKGLSGVPPLPFTMRLYALVQSDCTWVTMSDLSPSYKSGLKTVPDLDKLKTIDWFDEWTTGRCSDQAFCVCPLSCFFFPPLHCIFSHFEVQYVDITGWMCCAWEGRQLRHRQLIILDPPRIGAGISHDVMTFIGNRIGCEKPDLCSPFHCYVCLLPTHQWSSRISINHADFHWAWFLLPMTRQKKRFRALVYPNPWPVDVPDSNSSGSYNATRQWL